MDRIIGTEGVRFVEKKKRFDSVFNSACLQNQLRSRSNELSKMRLVDSLSVGIVLGALAWLRLVNFREISMIDDGFTDTRAF